VSRTGDNGGGQGGRNYRFNWGKALADGSFGHGEWRIRCAHPGTTLPWIITHNGDLIQRTRFERQMARRFKTAENAQRWIELYSRRSGL
jgi:hypothetical protein